VVSEITNKNNNLGEYVKEIRTLNGLSVSQLARDTKISQPYLTQIESNERIPTPEILKKLYDGLALLADSSFTYSKLLEKAGYEELAKGQHYLEIIEDFSDDPEQDIRKALSKIENSIQASNVEEIQQGGNIKEQVVTEKNLYDLQRVLKQISKPVTFDKETLTDDEKSLLYGFIELLLEHRK
jgi:transcriptional regulator with XRE-family HTH domain